MDVCWITEAGPNPVAFDVVREFSSRDDGVLWIDFDHTDDRGMALLADLVPVRAIDLDDCHTRSPVPKLRPYADYIFSSLNGLARGTDGRLHFLPLKIFIRERLLVTVFGPRHEALPYETSRRDLDAVRRQLAAHELHARSVFELGGAIRMEMLRTQEELVASAAARIAELELNLLQRDAVAAEGLLHDLFALRHDLQTIHTNAAQTHELYGLLSDRVTSQAGLMRLDPRVLHDLRQAYGHLRNSTDLEREYLQEVLDMFQTRVSTELNRFVRKITAFGTIGISWTVIAGVYGMNFTFMPELNWRFGYPAVIGLMAVVGLVLVVLFHRRGWL